jgi:DNA primase
VALRRDYARQLAGWLGLPETDELVAQARGSVSHAARTRPDAAAVNRGDPAQMVERESLKLALQEPSLAGAEFDALESLVFTAAPYAAVHSAVLAAGGTARGLTGEPWVATVREHATDDPTRSLVTELAVEPLLSDEAADARYADALAARLEELAVTRHIAETKGRLQRLNPVEQVEQYNRMFGTLVALEQRRRQLRERSIGAL